MHGICLFLINGLGMGNSTRCYAIMEHLAARGVELHVLTSGNGLAFFGDKPEVRSVTPMEALFYSSAGGQISGLRTLGHVGRLYRLARTKRRQLEELLRRLRPDLAVTDSEYATAPLRRRGIPIIGLNNAEVVVSEYLRDRAVPPSVRGQFWLVEFPDYLFHKATCELVLSPSPRPLPPRHPAFKRIGMIIRRALHETVRDLPRGPFPAPRELRRVVFMLSGSVYASVIPFDRTPVPYLIDVVGRPGADGPNVRFHGRLLNNLALLREADALVVNGGFSAVSEALALNKPTFVIPVRGHAEQFINARAVANLGRGYIADERTILDDLNRLHALNRWEGLAPQAPTTGFDGAREAADIICEHLAARTARPGQPDAP